MVRVAEFSKSAVGVDGGIPVGLGGINLEVGTDMFKIGDGDEIRGIVQSKSELKQGGVFAGLPIEVWFRQGEELGECLLHGAGCLVIWERRGRGRLVGLRGRLYFLRMVRRRLKSGGLAGEAPEGFEVGFAGEVGGHGAVF